MARKPMQKPLTDTDAAPSLPGDPDNLSQILTKLAQLEGATLALAEKVDALNQPPSIDPETLVGILRETAEKLVDEKTIELTATANSCRNDVADLMASAKKAAAAATEAASRALEQTIADGRTALKAALQVQVRETREALRASTEAATGVHEKIGATAAALEATAEQLRYYRPEMTQLAERRLRIVGRHTGLISSAATVTGVAVVQVLLHVLGIR